jgi:hypothetical protein
MPHSYFYLNWDYIIKVNANFLALDSKTIDYITFTGSTVEPDYRQRPNSDWPTNRRVLMSAADTLMTAN